MEKRKASWKSAALAAALAFTPALAKDGKWDLFLLFGQSNMAGPPRPDAADKETNPRIKVLAFDNCSALARTYNQWYLASPPLHECINGVGPGDWFSKTLIDTSQKLGLGIDTIGLIPCSISGAPIDYFMKGVASSRRNEFKIPPDNAWPGAYPFMVARIQEAQKKGVVRGILFHQGESNPGDPKWPGNVKTILDSLKKDLDLGDVPFVAGELRYDTNTWASPAHNKLVNQLPGLIKNCAVASADHLKGLPDPWHFNLTSMREFGHRYCAAMVPFLKAGASAVAPGRARQAISFLRTETADGALVIRASEPMDRVFLIAVTGEKRELGGGREIRIRTADFHAGLYVLAAVSGASEDFRKILIRP